jgi:hypothetical protein
MKLKHIMLGSDPEFGAVDINSLIPKSVVNILGGTKSDPLDLGRGCGRQEDNVGAELTIPPCETVEEFVDYITYGRKQIDNILSEANLKTVTESSLQYPFSELMSPQAREFGCEPSFCVYTRQHSPRPSPCDVGNTRSFGFHLHASWRGPDNIQTIEELIRTMDVYLGLPSLLIDKDTERRRIYGNAGDFRIKVYGLEYRTLGGKLLKDEETIKFVFNNAMKAFEDYNEKANIDQIIKNQVEIRNAIDTSNEEVAVQLLNYFNIKTSLVYA